MDTQKKQIKPVSAPNSSSEGPVYLRLAEIIKQHILSGVYPCSKKIPSEMALSREHGLALMTVRQAVGVLVEHGLLERVPGRGTFVKELTWSGAPFFIDSLVETVRAKQTKVNIIKSEVHRASVKVAAQLGVEVGDSVIFLRRHITGEEGVLLIQEGYLLLDPKRPVVEAELEATYITGLFTGSGEGLIKRAMLSISPVILTEEDAAAFCLGSPTVGFRLDYSFFDAALSPLAVGCFVSPADRLTLKAEIGINS